MATTSILPVETIEMEILPRLPVKSLLRFKSVCKSWNLLISSNNFIKSFRKSNHDSLTLMLKRKIKEVKFSVAEYVESKWIVGCINGLVCVYDSIGYFGAVGFVIWNPATKQCLKIVASPRRVDLRYNEDVLGFGFDSVSNDFKILHVTAIEKQPLVGYIYSCNARCWSKLAPSNFLHRGGYIFKHWQPIIVNEYLFWLNGKGKYYEEDMVVISFDVRQEVFRLLPDFSSIRERKLHCNLLNFRNSVAVMDYCRCTTGETIDIYIFNERCRDWSKMSVGPLIHMITKQPNSLDNLEYLQCFSNGDIVFISSHRKELYCVNIQNSTIESLGKLRDHVLYGCTYSESLIFIDGMKPFYKKEVEVRLFFLKNDCKGISKRENTKKEYSKKSIQRVPISLPPKHY